MIFTFFNKLLPAKKSQFKMGHCIYAYSTMFFTFALLLNVWSTAAWGEEANSALLLETANYEAAPIAFAPNYIGLIVNQNHPWSYGQRTWAKGGPSFGAEYRFFYKDSWTLAISLGFKKLVDAEGNDKSLLSQSQESMRIIRLYHPLYLGVGGKFSLYSPVRKITLPYERDDTRAIDNGVSLCLSALWLATPRMTMVMTVSRWRSLSTTKRQGLEVSLSSLYRFR